MCLFDLGVQLLEKRGLKKDARMKFTVAIDGPAAAGKGTIARAVAAHFEFAYLDTGLLYRAAARKAMDGMDPVAAAKALTRHDFERVGLRTAKVGQAASKIAALPKVRAALVEFQQSFARSEGGAVLDGRDIGTVICPEAEVKLYVTASDEVRAVRRHAELVEKSPDLTVADVLADLRARDARDTERKVAPLMAAADAVVLDTSSMTIDEAVAAAIAVVEAVVDGRAAV
jgi:CMP/dCMP kinase